MYMDFISAMKGGQKYFKRRLTATTLEGPRIVGSTPNQDTDGQTYHDQKEKRGKHGKTCSNRYVTLAVEILTIPSALGVKKNYIGNGTPHGQNYMKNKIRT